MQWVGVFAVAALIITAAFLFCYGFYKVMNE